MREIEIFRLTFKCIECSYLSFFEDTIGKKFCPKCGRELTLKELVGDKCYSLGFRQVEDEARQLEFEFKP